MLNTAERQPDNIGRAYSNALIKFLQITTTILRKQIALLPPANFNDNSGTYFGSHDVLKSKIKQCGEDNSEIVAEAVSELIGTFGLYPALVIEGETTPLYGVGWAQEDQSYFGVVRISDNPKDKPLNIPIIPSNLEFIEV